MKKTIDNEENVTRLHQLHTSDMSGFRETQGKNMAMYILFFNNMWALKILPDYISLLIGSL